MRSLPTTILVSHRSLERPEYMISSLLLILDLALQSTSTKGLTLSNIVATSGEAKISSGALLTACTAGLPF